MPTEANPPVKAGRTRRGRGDDGYALIAAVTAVAAFAYVAFQVLAANQGETALLSARAENAKLGAAAEAGLALAIHGLGANDRGQRWSIDGRQRTLTFEGLTLTIVIEDERGKAPLGGLNDGQSRALFAGAGAPSDRIDALVAEFREWQTDDTTVTAPGEAPTGPPVRHGYFRTLGELAELKDMDPATLARIAPAVTLFFEESGGFAPDHATPLARATMSAQDLASPEQLADEAQTDAQRPEEDLGSEQSYAGRTLTVRVTARAPDGAEVRRAEIIELTGDKTRPVWIRYAD